MTTKRDSKRKQARSAKRPKLKKDKLSDLDAKHQAESVKGGYYTRSDSSCCGRTGFCGR